MAKWKERIWFKILLWIGLIGFGELFAGALCFAVLADDWGVSHQEKEVTLAERIKEANQSNSAMALMAYLDGTDLAKLTETDENAFQYGIIKCSAADLSGVDLKDASNYLEYHFIEKDWTEKDLTYFYYNVTEETNFSFSKNLLWNECYVYDEYAEEYTQDGEDAKEKQAAAEESDKEGHFWVVSYHPADNDAISDWKTGNRYQKATALNDIFYQYTYPVAAAAVFFLAAAVTCLVLLCASAGHRNGREGICTIWLQRIPLEVEWAGLLIMEGLCMACVMASSDMGYYDEASFLAFVTVIDAEVTVAVCLAVGALLNFAVRVKAGAWWKNTVCWRVCAGICRFGARVFGGIGKNRTLFFKTVWWFAVIMLLEFLFLIVPEEASFEIVFWLLGKIILAVVLFLALGQMKKLLEGSRRMAEGDLTHRIDTDKMFRDFRQHGENLNSISAGISRAVEERMKSERFKTELITNVSHDIKTPLTSIINYVDLLAKEEFDNPKAKEYLEVLERQSARLKKLIEDLMEASKASTGNLAVHLERLEAGVFLVQTVGEFEEKMTAAQLELIIQKPEKPVYLLADGRHFWRVIDNLMNNICKYAQPGTRVYINLECQGDDAVLMFRNTSRYALNISSEELLERFVRGDSSRNTEGSGLGLSIAQSLMELMHGKLELYVDGDLFKVVLRFAQSRE